MLRLPDSRTFRALLAIVLGIGASTLLIGAWLVGLWSWWDPGPGDVTAPVPSTVLAWVIAGYILGAALGGGIAAILAEEDPGVCAAAVGCVQTVVALATLSAEVHQGWFMMSSPVVHLPAALAGARVALGRWPFSRR